MSPTNPTNHTSPAADGAPGAPPPGIHLVRRENLMALLRDFIDKQVAQGVPTNGIEKLFAEYLKLSSARLSQFKSSRNMSVKVVEQIESLSGKPQGWLSEKHSESNIATPPELAFLDLARAAWHHANAKGKRDLMRLAKRGFSQQDL